MHGPATCTSHSSPAPHDPGEKTMHLDIIVPCASALKEGPRLLALCDGFGGFLVTAALILRRSRFRIGTAGSVLITILNLLCTSGSLRKGVEAWEGLS